MHTINPKATTEQAQIKRCNHTSTREIKQNHKKYVINPKEGRTGERERERERTDGTHGK